MHYGAMRVSDLLRPFTFLAMLLVGEAFAQTTLEVNVILNRPDAVGTLKIALCLDKQSYDTEVGCMVRSVPATSRTVVTTFDDVLPGHAAVKVFHDVNDDGKLNTSWIGWPQEPYGFSNDAPVNMGPPPFRLARIDVKEGRNVTRIALR